MLPGRFASPVNRPEPQPSREDDPTPLYHRIHRELVARMRDGRLPLGSQVPTEQQLCEAYGVSRVTARRALEQLRQEGLIDRVRGRGSFVARLPEARARTLPQAPPPGAPRGIAVLVHGDIGHIWPEKDESWSRFLRGLEQVVAAKGYRVSFLFSNPGEARPPLRERFAEGERYAAAICPVSPGLQVTLAELEARGIPWLTINPASRTQTHRFVSADNHGGGRRVGRLFAHLGYAPVAVVSRPLSLSHSIADKFFGFLDGYLGNGGKSTDILFTEIETLVPRGAALRPLEELLARKPRPRAVFCAGDIVAAELLRLARERGVAVPGELAIVGGTGLALAGHTDPPLTVLEQPMEEMGREAGRLVLELIRSGGETLAGRYVFSPLTGRASCPVPPGFE